VNCHVSFSGLFNSLCQAVLKCHPALDAGSNQCYNLKMKEYYVYIITNYDQSVLYTGVTSDLTKRIYEHKNKLTDGFSKKYNLQYLIYYETHNDINIAISREKLIKRWKRQWKIDLIKKINPQFIDLYNNENIMAIPQI